jgi:Zn-dependent protease with chaperone function
MMHAVIRVLWLAAAPIAWADSPSVTLTLQMEANGEATARTMSRRAELQDLDLVTPAVLRCRGRIANDRFGGFRCSNAFQRDGLSLEAVFDLTPITQKLDASDEIQIWVDYPRLGFDTSSTPLKDQGALWHISRSAQFTADSAPQSIRIQFGYHRDQLAGIYLPLAALALVLTLISAILSKAGFGHVNRSAFLLGTLLWLGVASRLQAADPLRILLSGTLVADIAAAFFLYCPPLLCVAAGVAWGEKKQIDRTSGELFGSFFWSSGMLLFPMSGAMAAIPSMTEGDWISAAPCLAVAPLSFLLCRWRIRKIAATSVRQLGSGELKDRVSELAAKAGRADVQVYVYSSTRSQAPNAFALLRNSIALTAPLVRALSRREVDAVAAHELSHFGHPRRSPWAALAVAVVLFQTPLAETFLPASGGLWVAVLVPLAVFFLALRGARKREFAADSGSVALTGDPRSLISGLARIARTNHQPLAVNAVMEWFSTHPSTYKRIRALAGAARLDPAEVETLCNSDAVGEFYTLPPENTGTIFTLAWQQSNATRYVWSVLISTSGAGLLVAWLLSAYSNYAGAGVLELVAGIVLGCALTKLVAATVMARNYARLRGKLARKLGIGGQLVGLAPESEPRLYNGYRFADAGFLSFEGGRLCYTSEYTTLRINASDVMQVEMVAAAPSGWRRLQPMVRFRQPDTGEGKAFILHPVEWGATPGRLFQSIQQWRATATSMERTSISGFNEIAGKPFSVPAIAGAVRSFRIPAGITMVGVTLSGWWFQAESWPAWYALGVTACVHLFMYLPALLYRPSPPPGDRLLTRAAR